MSDDKKPQSASEPSAKEWRKANARGGRLESNGQFYYSETLVDGLLEAYAADIKKAYAKLYREWADCTELASQAENLRAQLEAAQAERDDAATIIKQLSETRKLAFEAAENHRKARESAESSLRDAQEEIKRLRDELR